MKTVQAVLKCKHCGREETRTLRLPDDVSAIPNEFECVACNEGKTAFAHVRDPRAYFETAAFRHELSPEQKRDFAKTWRDEHREYCNRKAREYQKAHPELGRKAQYKRRAREYNAPGVFDYDKWLQRVEYFNWKCAYCGVQLTEQTLTCDHYKPLSRGGSSSIISESFCAETTLLFKEITRTFS